MPSTTGLRHWRILFAFIPVAVLADPAMLATPLAKVGSCPSGYSTSGQYCMPGSKARFAIEKHGALSQRLRHQWGLLPGRLQGTASDVQGRELSFRLVHKRRLLPTALISTCRSVGLVDGRHLRRLHRHHMAQVVGRQHLQVRHRRRAASAAAARWTGPAR